ncbi:MAG: hypothetical protein MSH49_06730 [[Eubacterium] saphenum]|nr:hypothetical protein [[Eubacterium] saphenum]
MFLWFKNSIKRLNEKKEAEEKSKADAEHIVELENQLVDTQAALIELAGIVGGADDGNG